MPSRICLGRGRSGAEPARSRQAASAGLDRPAARRLFRLEALGPVKLGDRRGGARCVAAPSSAGVLPPGVIPSVSSRWRISGSASAATTASCNRPIASAGVPAGPEAGRLQLLESRKALLGDGRDVGQDRDAPGRGDAECAQPPSAPAAPPAAGWRSRNPCRPPSPPRSTGCRRGRRRGRRWRRPAAAGRPVVCGPPMMPEEK